MSVTDSRPSLRAVRHEQQAIKLLMDGQRHEGFQMGYLMGISLALLWMSERETTPPSVMFETLRDMLAIEKRRRKRKARD